MDVWYFFSIKQAIGLQNISIIFLFLVRHKNTFVVENNKYGSLNTVNCDVNSDVINNTVDTHDRTLHVKPELLSRLKSVAAREAWKIKHIYFKMVDTNKPSTDLRHTFYDIRTA